MCYKEIYVQFLFFTYKHSVCSSETLMSLECFYYLNIS